MTRIKQTGVVITLMASIAGCAGGNAIDQGVPGTALSQSGPETFPAPIKPGDAPLGVETTAPQPLPPTVSPALPETTVTTASPTALPPAAAGGPINTGTFPNTAVERPGATTQLTDEERDAKILELQALQSQQADGFVSTEAYRKRLLELQRLAKTHSRATISKIEAQ